MCEQKLLPRASSQRPQGKNYEKNNLLWDREMSVKKSIISVHHSNYKTILTTYNLLTLSLI
jgi:hypothetical protein